MGQFAGLGLGVWALALCVSACTSSSSSKPSTGTAGSAGAGAANGGATNVGGGTSQGGDTNAGAAGSAGAAGGTSVLGDSKTEACIAYAIAECSRLELCTSRTTADCLATSFTCPDLLFSDGATRTVADLKACAETLKTFPCDKMAAGYLPDCVSPGTRMGGESCSFSSQCASLACKVPSASSCGVCKTPGVLGGTCSADIACSAGQHCGTSGVCEAVPPDPTAPGGEGDSCAEGQGCFVDMYCSPAHICTKEPTLGASCKDNPYCPSGSYCAPDTLKCTVSPSAGAACASNSIEMGFCADDSYCLANVCTAFPALGAPCMVDPQTSQIQRYSCADGGHCNSGLLMPVCVASGAPGAICEEDDDCNAGLRCLCPDLTRCDASICIQLRYAGESCGAPGMVCHPGFSCTDGKCQPIDSHGTFAACPG
jgi:hypothetical protein